LFTFGGWERTGHKGHKEDTKDTKSDCLKSLQPTPQKAASGKLARISSEAWFKRGWILQLSCFIVDWSGIAIVNPQIKPKPL
jgi:hypothetical protein